MVVSFRGRMGSRLGEVREAWSTGGMRHCDAAYGTARCRVLHQRVKHCWRSSSNIGIDHIDVLTDTLDRTRLTDPLTARLDTALEAQRRPAQPPLVA